MPMASCAYNGNNETNIGLSQAISISFSDNNGNEIEMNNSSKLIDLWIPRDPNIKKSNFVFVNATKRSNTTNESQLLPIGITSTFQNSSIHLQILPLNASVGYIVLLKFNMTPRINLTFQDYDSWRMFCPSGKILRNDEILTSLKLFFLDLVFNVDIQKQIYLFFMNSNSANYKGFIGLGIRELQNSELTQYCPNSRPSIPPYFEPTLNESFTQFTNDFYFLAYISGCYFIDQSTGFTFELFHCKRIRFYKFYFKRQMVIIWR